MEESAEEERLRLLEQAQREAQEAAQRAAQEAAAQAEAIRRAEAERLAEIARQAESERQAVLAAQEAQRRAATQRQHASLSIPPPITAPVTMPAESGESAISRAVPVTTSAVDKHAGFVSLAAWTQDATLGYSAVSPESPRDFSFAVDNGSADNRFEFANPGMRPGMDENLFRAPVMPESASVAQRNAWDRPHFSIPGSEMLPESRTIPAHPAKGGAEAIGWGVPMFSGETAKPAQAPRSVPPSTISHSLPIHASGNPDTIQEQAPDAVEDWEKPVLPSWLEELPHARTAAEPGPGAQAAPVPHLSPPAVQAAEPVPPHEGHFWMTDTGKPTPFAAPALSASIVASPHEQRAHSPAVHDRNNFQYPAMRMPMTEVGAQADTQRQDFPMPTEMRQATMHSGTGYGASTQDPLLASRERITRNWFALKSVFHPESAKPEQPMPRVPERTPALAVFSLAGGVGKTSLLAALARALSSRAERVLLVDLSAYGLMPFFFGARDQKPGQLRTFSPPSATADAAIHLVTLDPERLKGEVAGQDALVREIQQHAGGVNRILIDLPTASGTAMRRMLRFHPTVLVPLMPDMNSVVSVGAIESFFQSQMAQSNAQSQPLYVLNHFDPAQQLHVDVRNLLREQIGNRLLPFVLRSSAAVSEALAEGMTVMDYAPGTVIAEDYLNLANWIRSLSAPAAVAPRGARWSEQ